MESTDSVSGNGALLEVDGYGFVDCNCSIESFIFEEGYRIPISSHVDGTLKAGVGDPVNFGNGGFFHRSIRDNFAIFLCQNSAVGEVLIYVTGEGSTNNLHVLDVAPTIIHHSDSGDSFF